MSLQSAAVQGSPWILFSAERFQDFLCFLEDGRLVGRLSSFLSHDISRHGDLLTHGLPEDYKVASARENKESLGSPHISLYNSSQFRDEEGENWWSNGEQRLSCISGDCGGGVWAVTHDLSVLYREGTGHGSGDLGSGWLAGLGKMRSVSVGAGSVWGVSRADEVFVRTGLTAEEPRGKEWTKIEGSMRSVSVGPTGVCWAVDNNNTVWRRAMAR